VTRREAGADERRRRDPIWLRGVKYTLVTAIEACVDVAQHICATEGWGRRRTMATRYDCSVSTASSPVLARSIRQAVGFRNVLVHDYLRVDDDTVIDRLKAPGDLDDFVSQVAGFVTQH
jgi:uncharacterized protein YutE (UPF0331/DUF86 family)